jgi:hypothetical protein
MTEIKNERDLKDFLRRKHAVLFFHASWSLYAMISKEIMEFVENHAIMQQRNVSFFFGEFEDDRLPLAEAIVARGVPGTVAFAGNGSLSFFRLGQHMLTMRSVIGEGTWAVWRHMDELFGEPTV